MMHLSTLAKIPDTPKRLAAAADLVREIKDRNDTLVSERNLLMLVLLRQHGWKKMDIIRAAGVSRTAFVGKPYPGDPDRDVKPNPGGLLAREPSVLPEVKGTSEGLGQRLEAIRNEIASLRDTAKEARRIRDEAVEELLFRRDDPWPNHKVCEVSGLDSARVAQLRIGALV